MMSEPDKQLWKAELSLLNLKWKRIVLLSVSMWAVTISIVLALSFHYNPTIKLLNTKCRRGIYPSKYIGVKYLIS